MTKRILTASLKVGVPSGPLTLSRGDTISLAVNKKTGGRRLYLYAGAETPEKYKISAQDASRLLEKSEGPQTANEAADLYALGASLIKAGKFHQGLRALAYSALCPSSTELTAALMTLNNVNTITAALGDEDGQEDVSDEDALSLADTVHQDSLDEALLKAEDPEEAIALDVSLDGSDSDEDFDAEEDEGEDDYSPLAEPDDADDDTAEDVGVATARRKALSVLATGKQTQTAAAVGKRVGNTPRNSHFASDATVKILAIPGLDSVEFSPTDSKKRRYRFFAPERDAYRKGFCVAGTHIGVDGLVWTTSVAHPKLAAGLGVFRSKADAQKAADWLNKKYPPSQAEQKKFNDVAAARMVRKRTKPAVSKVAASAVATSRKEALTALAATRISPHADGGGQIDGLIVNGKGPFELYYNLDGIVEDLELDGKPVSQKDPIWFEVQTLVRKKYYKPKTHGRKPRRAVGRTM